MRPSSRSSAASSSRSGRRRRSGASVGCAAPPRTTCASCRAASRVSSSNGMDVLLDCANGATFKVAPEIFRRLGAQVTVLAAEPDGRNINDGCGSTHIELLERADARRGTRDRLRLRRGRRPGPRPGPTGEVVDGDELLALAALHLRDQGRLSGNGVAVTVMSNSASTPRWSGRGSRSRGRRSVTVTCSRSCGERLDARRGAVGTPHRAWLQPHRRRDRRRSADAGGAGRPRSGRSRRDAQTAPAPGQRPRPRPPGDQRTPSRSRARSARPSRSSRGVDASCSPQRHRAARQGDGRGPQRGGGRRDLRPAGGARGARARAETGRSVHRRQRR